MRFSTISLLFSLVAFIGCSPSDSGGDNTTTAQLNSSSLPQAGGDSQTVTPTQAVTHFLEALRSGDEALATSMLTDKAQAEMEKNEAAIKPPGSPTATFAVTEEEILGDEQNGAHVLSSWTDSDESGDPRTYEIVWILRKKGRGWAIAGMATRVFEDQEPLILNFEDPLDAQRKRQAVDQEISRRSEGETVEQAQQQTPISPR